GDHARNLASTIEARQGQVSAAGLRAAELLLHREPPPPGFAAHLRAGEEVAEVDRPHLGPDPIRRTKVGNAALGRNPGAGERNDRARPLEQLGQAVDRGLKIGRNHVYYALILMIRAGFGPCSARHMRSPCDISIPCCASATSTRRSTSTATSSASRKCGAASTTRTAIRWCSWRARRTPISSRRASATAATLRWSS